MGKVLRTFGIGKTSDIADDFTAEGMVWSLEPEIESESEIPKTELVPYVCVDRGGYNQHGYWTSNVDRYRRAAVYEYDPVLYLFTEDKRYVYYAKGFWARCWSELVEEEVTGG